MDWTSIKKELPKIPKDKIGIEVEVRTQHNGTGKCQFAYTGAPGEDPRGMFWFPIREFKGDVHLENEIVDWKYIDK